MFCIKIKTAFEWNKIGDYLHKHTGLFTSDDDFKMHAWCTCGPVNLKHACRLLCYEAAVFVFLCAVL